MDAGEYQRIGCYYAKRGNGVTYIPEFKIKEYLFSKTNVKFSGRV